jgi:hypothetical protein
MFGEESQSHLSASAVLGGQPETGWTLEWPDAAGPVGLSLLKWQDELVL